MRAGAIGALAAWVAFTFPSALLMFAFALASRTFRGAVADAVVHGLKVAAVAVVAQALLGMARTLTPDVRRIAIAGTAAAVMMVIANPAAQMTVISAGALAGLALCEPGQTAFQHHTGRAPHRALGAAAIAAFVVLLATLPVFAGTNPWFDMGNVFYRVGALVFGGGHVVLPLLREGLVPRWMNETTFLSGYGAAQTVPGPLFSIASYLGAVANPNAPAIGSTVATVAIFLPGLLLLTGSMAFRHKIMGNELARRAMAGVNAVVVGILAAALYDPLWRTGIASVLDAGVAVTGLFLLLRFKAPPILVVGLCVVVNVALAV